MYWVTGILLHAPIIGARTFVFLFRFVSSRCRVVPWFFCFDSFSLLVSFVLSFVSFQVLSDSIRFDSFDSVCHCFLCFFLGVKNRLSWYIGIAEAYSIGGGWWGKMAWVQYWIYWSLKRFITGRVVILSCSNDRWLLTVSYNILEEVIFLGKIFALLYWSGPASFDFVFVVSFGLTGNFVVPWVILLARFSRRSKESACFVYMVNPADENTIPAIMNMAIVLSFSYVGGAAATSAVVAVAVAAVLSRVAIWVD